MLLDADIICYQAVTLHTKDKQVNNEVMRVCVVDAAINEMEDRINEFYAVTRSRACALCWSSGTNWRQRVYANYKKNRDPRKPVGYAEVKKHFTTNEWAGLSYQEPDLEADDLLGMFATSPKYNQKAKTSWHTVLVSEDKDLTQIPGMYYDPRNPDRGIQQIAPHVGQIMHFVQTLCGDPTDGYPGCAGIGPKKATDILSGCALDLKKAWKAVVAAFVASGKTKKDALVMAQIAYIMRYGDLQKNGKVKLWSPNRKQ